MKESLYICSSCRRTTTNINKICNQCGSVNTKELTYKEYDSNWLDAMDDTLQRYQNHKNNEIK